MIYLDKCMGVNLLKKEAFTGSYKGMRYRIVKREEELEVYIWPQPYNYENTDDEAKQVKQFSFSEEGVHEAVDWLNERYEEDKVKWNHSCMWKV